MVVLGDVAVVTLLLYGVSQSEATTMNWLRLPIMTCLLTS
jgi:hypothetical protein